MKLTWTNSTAIKKGFRAIKTRMTKGIIETSKQATPFGFDSNPSKNFVAIVSETMGNDEPIVVGYLNPKALGALNVGDSAQYSTDTDGNIKATVIARNDGTLEILGTSDYMVRFNELNTSFEQLKTDLNALVSAFNQHVHASSGAPPTPVPSIIPATPSTTDISKAKIKEVKTIS